MNSDPEYGTVASGGVPAVLYHGTRADLAVGDLLGPGFSSNYGEDLRLSWIYMSGTLDAATWGAELAVGEARPRIYVVEPTGPIEDDPNLTNKKFPGNQTLSYRSRDPLRIINEVLDWVGHPADQLQAMKANVARLLAEGAPIID
ncbi:NAD(+)--rifampin ADP-ribosyltransferase [soil metagenome]